MIHVRSAVPRCKLSVDGSYYFFQKLPTPVLVFRKAVLPLGSEPLSEHFLGHACLMHGASPASSH